MFKSQARFRDCWVLHISLSSSADKTNNETRETSNEISLKFGKNLASVGAELRNGKAQG